MVTFLGFFKNNMTGDEFVAPVDAESRNDAEWMLVRQYPSGVYSLLTIYARKEMEKILADVERWPGLASKVQPTVDQLLSRVTVGTRLPPLPTRSVNETTPRVDGARIAQVKAAAAGVNAQAQALALKLLKAELHGTVGSSVPDVSNSRFAQVSDAKVAAKAPALPATPAFAKAAGAQMATGNRPSLITMLKAMKG